MRSIIIFVISVISYPSMAQVSKGKNIPFDFYTSDYLKYNVESWGLMKKQLDSLTYVDFSSVNSDFTRHAWFLLSRVAAINWHPKQRPEISIFLHSFYQRLLNKTASIDRIRNISIRDNDFLDLNVIFLPHKTIWAAIRINEASVCFFLEKLEEKSYIGLNKEYELSLKTMMIWILGQKFKSDTVSACLDQHTSFLNMELTNYQRQLFNNYAIKRNMLIEGSEINSIKFLSNLWRLQFNKIDSFSPEAQLIWRNYALMYSEVYPKPNISIVLDQVEGEVNVEQKYVLLFFAAFLTNKTKRVSYNEAARRADTERLKELSNKIYQNMKVMNKSENFDYLKSAINSI